VSVPAPRHAAHTRRVLIALSLLFLAPVAAAFILYYGIGWSPGRRVNHGELVEPPVPLPDLALPRAEAPRAEVPRASAPRADAPRSFLKGKWTLLYLGAGDCAAGCRTELYNTRQVRSALGADRERVQRVFLAEGACCDLEWLRAQQPDLITVPAGAEAAPLTGILEHAGRSTPAADRVYLIDPLGNLMMCYAADARPKGMLEDLKKLLRLSHVG
jgi:cytochrome oxidase Cu insertion factor (SCO1/SenC/PrrC family)